MCKIFICISLSGLFLAGSNSVFGKKTKDEALKPNIILIVADDLGYGDVGFNGQTKISTPNIDKIAKEGIVFTNFYAGSTVCGPSRASLITGRHMGHCTVRGNPKWTNSGNPVDINDNDITIAEVLKQADYSTAIIGKWGLAENLSDGKPLNQGFDFFYGFNQHSPAHHYYPDSIWENNVKIRIEGNNWRKKETHYIQDLFTEKAKGFISRQNSQQPFFLYLAYTVPHYELTVPGESKAQYQTLNWPLREMKSGHYLHDKNGHVTYAGMVSRMDKQIGEIIELLKQQGLDENTIVIFTSDNGHAYDNVQQEFFNSNGPFRGKKRDLYEGGIHVPLAVRWPARIKPNAKSDHISAFWDLLPTLADASGCNIPANIDGISFLPTLLNEKQKQHEYLYWEFNERNGPVQSVRKGDWKFVKLNHTKIELYNLSTDIGEKNNVAQYHPEIVKLMERLLKEARTYHPEFTLERISRKKKK